MGRQNIWDPVMAIKTHKHLHPWWVAEVLNPCDRQPLHTWAMWMRKFHDFDKECSGGVRPPSQKKNLQSKRKKGLDTLLSHSSSSAEPMLIGVDLLAFSTLLATLAIYKSITSECFDPWEARGKSAGLCPLSDSGCVKRSQVVAPKPMVHPFSEVANLFLCCWVPCFHLAPWQLVWREPL